MKNTAEEQAYIQGFYSALKGTLYILNSKDASIDAARGAIMETLAEMEADGELEGIDHRVDELIDLANEAERIGKVDEFFEILDEAFGKKED